MSEKKRPTYTDEQKANVKRLLQEGLQQNKIVEVTGVGKGTVVKIAADLKAGTTKKPAPKSSTSHSPADVFKSELTAIQARKLEVEELLNGSLKRELEALELKETKILELIKLYP